MQGCKHAHTRWDLRSLESVSGSTVSHRNKHARKLLVPPNFQVVKVSPIFYLHHAMPCHALWSPTELRCKQWPCCALADRSFEHSSLSLNSRVLYPASPGSLAPGFHNAPPCSQSWRQSWHGSLTPDQGTMCL